MKKLYHNQKHTEFNQNSINKKKDLTKVSQALILKADPNNYKETV